MHVDELAGSHIEHLTICTL